MSEKRNKLEEVATEAVQRSGFHNLSFRTLADEVGVKSSSVHYYFPEKSHLAYALIENYTTALTEELNNIDKRKLTIKNQLKAFIQIFKDVIESDKFCLCGMLAAEVANLNDENRQLLRQYFQHAEDWLYKVFSGQQNSHYNGIDARNISRIVISGLEGAILLDRVDGGLKRLQAQQKLIFSFLD